MSGTASSIGCGTALERHVGIVAGKRAGGLALGERSRQGLKMARILAARWGRPAGSWSVAMGFVPTQDHLAEDRPGIALGLLQPTEGEVAFGGIPMRQLGMPNCRRQIGTVMQEDKLLTGSLADHIAFFDMQLNLARVEVCARLADLHDDIVRMPMGYRTLVGDLGGYHGLA
ncbi:hypothetical protein [Roseateles amylovorans]|uniref:Uncharacterized protein n=1 Tax=Roseateles amylovorans TaxID=2978473 RepID=A0ABY6B4S3_9BURK|nr:hypothetical protein [Roseateles amylovorans]UXH80343.1 hypothetical protein N4261_10890 [Roseateles amylovorans]